MATYIATTAFIPTFLDDNGDPLNGGTLESYVANTTTPTPTFTGEAGVSAGDIITLNARGEPQTSGNTHQVWIDSAIKYDFVLKTAGGDIINSPEDVASPLAGSVASALNIAAAKALTTLTDGQALYIRGYTTAGGGGGGMYIYDASSAATANDGTVLALDTLVGRLIYSDAAPATVETFGAEGDGVANDTVATQAALNSGIQCVVIPSGTTVRIDVEVSIPDGVDLTIDGTIQGFGRLTALGSSTISGVGRVACGNLWQLKATAGDVNIHSLTFGKGSTYGVYVYASDTINSLKIQNNSFNGNQYGVLKNNNSDTPVYSVLISDNLIENSSGDGIEWNIGTTDERITIRNNTVYNTSSDIVNAGLGIGVAGKAYTNDNDPANQTKYVMITDNFVKGAGQGIHCENVSKVKISGNHVSDCTASFAGIGLSDIGAITTYQVSDCSITDNYIYDCDSSINVLFGVLVGVFVGSPENINISGNSIINAGQASTTGAPYTAGGYTPDDYPTITIKNNSLMNSSLLHRGACNLFIESNTISTLSGDTGLTVDYRTGAFGDPAYLPAYNLFFVAKNNSVYDKSGRVNVSFSNISSGAGYDGNIKVHQHGNSFTIPVDDSFAQGSNRTISTASSSGFPYGIEFQAGDIVVNTATPAMYIVTTAGSRNKSSDSCVVTDEAAGVVRTGNYNWTAGDNKEWGQAITLTAGATVITGYVDRVYVASGQYRLDVVDASGAAVDLSAIGNETSATITATNPVVYTQVV